MREWEVGDERGGEGALQVCANYQVVRLHGINLT